MINCIEKESCDYLDSQFIESFSFDGSNLLIDCHLKSGNKLIEFNDCLYFKIIDEGNALQQHGEGDCDLKHWFYIYDQSSLIDWFNEKTDNLYQQKIKHFFIYTENEMIDVISQSKPTINSKNKNLQNPSEAYKSCYEQNIDFNNLKEIPELDRLVFEESGLNFILNFTNQKVNVNFGQHLLFREKTLGNLELNTTAWLLRLQKSELIDWFNWQSCEIHKNRIQHFIIVTNTERFEILSQETPQITTVE